MIKSEPKETFHVHMKRGRATHRITVMAVDKAAAARIDPEIAADGWVVDKVRRAPAPAGMGAPTSRRF
jgi:hypothetical protein